MYSNESHFPGGQPTRETRLSALNLNDTSSGGGLTFSAKAITLPVGAVILRLFMPKPGRPDFGEWWFTPFAFKRLANYFGVDASMMTGARGEGRSALHGAFGLLSEWYDAGGSGPNATQLSRFHEVKITQPTYAMYGEGDVATTTGYGRQIKPLKLDGGGTARQLFLPKPWEYMSAFNALTPATGGDSDTMLAPTAARHAAQKLPFE